MAEKYQIRYLPLAAQDLMEIVEHVKKDKPMAAIKLVQELNSKIRHLERFPNIGLIPQDTFLKRLDYKILVFENYLIFYKVIKHFIEIYRVIHGKREYRELLKP